MYCFICFPDSQSLILSHCRHFFQSVYPSVCLFCLSTSLLNTERSRSGLLHCLFSFFLRSSCLLESFFHSRLKFLIHNFFDMYSFWHNEASKILQVGPTEKTTANNPDIWNFQNDKCTHQCLWHSS